MIPYCQHEIRDEDREAVSKVLDSPRLTQGPAIDRFEQALADRTGANFVVAVSSGTSALVVALKALGVGPGDEVIVPSLSFLATANAVLLCNARPVFADVSRATLSLDPVDVARRVGPKTRGVVVVDYAGHVADVDALREVLGAGCFVLEDACHALGAEERGRALGGRADAACYSFHPAKHVATGEGGAIATRHSAIASTCRRLREHGVERESASWRGLGLPVSLATEEQGGWVYEMHGLSANHRLPDLGAALGLSQLARLDENLAARRLLAARYDEAFADEPRIETLAERPGTRSAWHLYPIRLAAGGLEGGRAALYESLHAEGIGVQVHYIPIHLQPYYREHLGTRFGDLPATEAAYLGLLSLPLYPQLSEADQQRVIDVIRRTLDAEAP